MSAVASKNLYEILGNDPEDEQPTKAPREVVKSTTSTRKRDEKVTPETRGPQRGGRSRYSGNEGAFRDRDAGSDRNRNRGTEPGQEAARGGRGGRGGRRGGRDFDRHSRTGQDEHEKQVAHGWGGDSGESGWADELAGVEIALKDAEGANPADPNAWSAEPEGDAGAAAAAAAQAAAEEEEKVKTYDEYLAELAARKANLGPPTEVRAPNDGARSDKKWAKAKPLEHDEETVFFVGESKDKTRNRERKTKQLLDIEPRFVEPREGRRGGGERGRGGGRGRGDRGSRGGGYSRGDRGDRGDRGERQERGGQRGGRDAAANVSLDSSSFPALGA